MLTIFILSSIAASLLWARAERQREIEAQARRVAEQQARAARLLLIEEADPYLRGYRAAMIDYSEAIQLRESELTAIEVGG